MTSIFVNLPVTDLARATSFYEALGYEKNPLFSDHNASCIVVEPDHSYFMILTREFFTTFTRKPVSDPSSTVGVLTAIALDSREEVDAMIERGTAAGGREPVEATDLGFMYTRDLEDPDGNTLEFFWMDPAAAEQGPPPGADGPAA